MFSFDTHKHSGQVNIKTSKAIQWSYEILIFNIVMGGIYFIGHLLVILCLLPVFAANCGRL